RARDEGLLAGARGSRTTPARVGRAFDRAAPVVRARPRTPLALLAQALLLRLRAPALDARDGATPRLRHARADDRRAPARGRTPGRRLPRPHSPGHTRRLRLKA